MNQAILGSPSSSGGIQGGDRSEDEVAFERSVIDFFLEAAHMLGVPKSVAAIYGAVFASPGPLCAADIETRLKISKGSVSQGLRVLREVGALSVATRTGDRREFFAPDMELRKLIQRWLADRLQKQLAAGGIRLAALNRSVPAIDRAEQVILRRRLKYLKSWHDKAGRLLPLAKTFLALT